MKKKLVCYDKPITEFGTARIDPFYYDQPPLEFINELKSPFYDKMPEGFGKRKIRDCEISAHGIYLDAADFNKNPLLETVFCEFERFTKIYGIGGNSYPLVLKKCDTPAYESYKINFSEAETTVYSSDTEGVRRALIYVMDELCRREGAFLPRGEISRRPWIKARITRGFFSPTNRPPKLADELFDDTDYYPEEYLNRLAHDGTNGIWIYTSFKQLLHSSYLEHHGDGSEKRIAKLREVVKKCARYGIKVFIFGVEPFHLVGDIAKSHSFMTGGCNDFGNYAICTETEAGKAYILEATEKLFRLIPDLGGFISITAGERVTNCASYPETYHSCPRCSKKSRGEILANTANLIKEGIRRSGSNAEFISWTYGHNSWEPGDIIEYVRKCDTDVMLMQNFEELSYTEQLGKLREGRDYWLSHSGPGELFKLTGNAAKTYEKRLWAKMQICCSHELATVPYIPAPGLVFDKYKGAREYGVEGVMQCWYFGNYPSVMSKAAGELSFTDDFSDKDKFLLKLAAIYYGESRAQNIADAWRLFEDGYKNYPLNIMFSYYGPMHDGIVWELQLKPKDNYLPRSWQLLDAPDGDRIYEALWQGHTLNEALTLSEKISDKWSQGLKILNLPADDELYTLCSALKLLFDSGRNILRFYKLRANLGLGIGDASTLLSELKNIVLEEIENSSAMIPLCETDKRLGYHSEAEGFKFFPKKIRHRIEKLRELLETEFPEVEKRISDGLPPLEFYLGMENGKLFSDAYMLRRENPECRKIPKTEHSFRITHDRDTLTVHIDAKTKEKCTLGFEFEPLVPSPTLLFGTDGSIDFVSQAYTHQSLFGEKIDTEKKKYTLNVTETADGAEYTLSVKKANIGWQGKPFRIRMSIDGVPLKESGIKLRFLAKWNEYPDTHIFVIPV